MELNTLSEVISLASRLEEESALFYEKVARRHPQLGDHLLAFSNENKKNKALTDRTYREAVSDAFETGFSFGEGLQVDDHLLSLGGASDGTPGDALKAALQMEEGLRAFYLSVAERARSLVAGVPGVFERLAKKREDRKRLLEELLVQARRER